MKTTRKVMAAFLAAATALTLAACGGATSTGNASDSVTAKSSPKTAAPQTDRKILTLDELQATVDKEATDGVASIKAEYDALMPKISDYAAYTANVGEVDAFYGKVLQQVDELGVTMRERAVDYAATVLSSGKSASEQYDDIDEMYDRIYEDAGDTIYDGVYDGILQDAYSGIYDGVVQSGYDIVAYQEWSDASSQAYKRWSDTSSDVYKSISDFRSDVYGFYSDIKGEIFAKDTERAQEKMERFQKKIDAIKAEQK